MKIHFEPAFLEQIVDEEITQKAHAGDTTLLDLFAKETHTAYSPALKSFREDIFANAYEYIASKLGLRKSFKECASKFQLLCEKIDTICVKRPEGRNEGSDIIKLPDNKQAIVLEIKPSKIRLDRFFTAYLPHELQRAQDMVDPEFGYLRESLSQLTIAEENIIRARYGTIWDIYIDTRLDSQLFTDKEYTERLRKNFAFDEKSAIEAYRFIRSKNSLSHKDIYSFCLTPNSLLGEDSSGKANTLYPGSPCPVCGFPSYSFTKISPDFNQFLKEDVDEVCPRCYEYYLVKSGRF